MFFDEIHGDRYQEIYEICDAIGELWTMMPDQRFGQLFYNFIENGEYDYYQQSDATTLKRIRESIDAICKGKSEVNNNED